MDIGSLLILKGAKIDEKMNSGWTPLINGIHFNVLSLTSQFHNLISFDLASANNHFQMVKLLVESGANINEITTDGKSALHYAMAMSNLQISRYLQTKGAICILKKTNV